MDPKNKLKAMIVVAILLMASVTVTLYVIPGTHSLGGEYESRIDLNSIDPSKYKHIGPHYKIIASDDYVFVLGGAAVVILDAQDKRNLRELSRIEDFRGFAGFSSLYIDDNWLYIGGSGGDFRIVNIANKTNPESVGGCVTNGSRIRSIVSDGSYAYLTDGDGISIVDIRDKEQPREVGRKETESLGHDILIDENIAFMSDITGGLFVFDISNKTNPMKISEYKSVDGHYEDIARYKNTLFCQVYAICVIVLDVSDPTQPREIKRIYEEPVSIGVHEDRLFVYNFSHEKMKVFKISDPESPKKVGSFEVGSFHLRNFSVDGNYLYIAENPVRVYRLEENHNFGFWIPVLTGWLVTAVVVGELSFVVGLRLWIQNRKRKLHLLQAQPERTDEPLSEKN